MYSDMHKRDDYWFKYIEYYNSRQRGHKAAMHVIDPTDLEATHAGGSWKFISLSGGDLEKEQKFKALFRDEDDWLKTQNPRT